MNSQQKFTPMMQQYLKIKEDYADAIVFFRLGDFYEMFFDDAIIASKTLEIALTSKNSGEKVPMCGIPHHAAKIYIQKLVEKGFKIAIAEQVTEAGKGLVEREVVKLITPGMIIDDGIIDGKQYNFIGAVCLKEHGYILAYSDITTGECFLIEGLNLIDLKGEVLSLNIKEIILPHLADVNFSSFLRENDILVTTFTSDLSDHRLIRNLQKDQREVAGILIEYLEKTQKQDLRHFLLFEVINRKDFMKVDYKVDRHLEITQSVYNQSQNTLLYYLDDTKTAMGSRRLKYILHHPLVDIKQLNERYDQIDFFRSHPAILKISELLSYVYDINRIVGRVAFNSVNARDLYYLKQTLKQIPLIIEQLNLVTSPLTTMITQNLNPHQELFELLESAIVDLPPLSIKEGGIIKHGYNQNLDYLFDIDTNGTKWLDEFEQSEKERTGIKNLKIGYNRVFGYYIEISKGNLGLVDDSFGYQRKQTLSNSERFISPILKQKEDDLLHAKEKSLALEYQLFTEIRDTTFSYVTSLQQLANQIANLDAYLALAKVSIKNRYVRPKLTTDRFVEIINGRHPVVEQNAQFVANHIEMKPHEIFLITGPNMSGKSTYMRMFALIIYMAQIGSFVPADHASLPVYDAIYTRIGSSDDLAGGKSTFMVEMLESNIALTHATANSVILFDEIGRGTATYDGLALAQGMIEYIHDKIKAQTLFSTHYHELTALEKKLDHVTNLYVAAKEQKDTMVFLHQVKRGASDKSYGIQVAQLAQLPASLIERSKQILRKLEKQTTTTSFDLFSFEAEEVIEVTNQMNVYVKEVIDNLEGLAVDNLTPIEALVRLKYYQDILKKKEDEE